MLTRTEMNRALAEIVGKMLADIRAYNLAHREDTDEDGWPVTAILDEITKFAILRHDDLMRFIYD